MDRHFWPLRFRRNLSRCFLRSFEVRSCPIPFFLVLIRHSSPKISGPSHDTMFGVKVPFNVHTCNLSLLTIPDFQLKKAPQTLLSWLLDTRHVHIPIFPQPKHSYRQRSHLGSNRCISWARSGLLATIRRRMGTSTLPGPRLQETEIHWKVAGWLVWAIHNKTRYALYCSRPQISEDFGLVLVSPFQVYPFIGLSVSAWFEALGTSYFLHRRVSLVRTPRAALVVELVHIQYFEAKKMTKQQIAVYMEERKWTYRSEFAWLIGFKLMFSRV